MWTIALPYTFLNIYIPAIIPTSRVKVASPPCVCSLLYLLWGLYQLLDLLDLSHCTKPEGRGIFCVVHCYRPSVSLWHLADSKTSANVWLKVSNLLTLGPCIWYSSHQLHFSSLSHPVKMVLVVIISLVLSHIVISLKKLSICFISDLIAVSPSSTLLPFQLAKVTTACQDHLFVFGALWHLFWFFPTLLPVFFFFHCFLQ